MRSFLTVVTVATLFSPLAFAPLPMARAVITLGEPGRLSAPPTGEYADAGTAFTGTWSGFVGVAVAPHYFVTAAHTGGAVGDSFTLAGARYQTESRTVIEKTDIALWRVKERFPRYAPLYDRADETGRQIVLWGRGAQRGQPVSVGGTARGWLWGAGNPPEPISWGTNRVAGVVALPGAGECLVFAFDASGSDTEATVSAGDSGGGVWIRDGKTWKLAGVLYASGGQYSRFADGREPFMAALTDARGLYQKGADGKPWQQLPPRHSVPIPTTAFASCLSAHTAAIDGTIGKDLATVAQNERRPWLVSGVVLAALGVVGIVALIQVSRRVV